MTHIMRGKKYGYVRRKTGVIVDNNARAHLLLIRLTVAHQDYSLWQSLISICTQIVGYQIESAFYGPQYGPDRGNSNRDVMIFSDFASLFVKIGGKLRLPQSVGSGVRAVTYGDRVTGA